VGRGIVGIIMSMTLQLKAHFDGKVIVPDEPLDVPVNQPLTVQVSLELAAGEDEAGVQWSSGIAREWAEDLADPRQDIYTLDDGEPVDEGR
jgi:hypothetical protein